MSEQKQVIFSGIQPSGILTLGNYLGAIKNWNLLQDEYDCIYSVVDMHAITVRQQASELRKRCVEVMALLIASGLDAEKNILFCQSHVSQHAELAWVLSCYTYMGELNRMTQFKDKSAKHQENINAGLFTYPILMMSDILLYQTNLVPVGADQKQHLEITRDVAMRFNSLYGEVFTVPEAHIPKVGARVMSLADPMQKMSKSDDNENAYVSMLDSPEVIVRKFKRAVTDSDNNISYKNGKDGVKNLLTIYAACQGREVETVDKDFEGQGYGQLKAAVADVVIEALKPIQDEYNRLLKDKVYLGEIMNKGASCARPIAQKTLSKVYKKVGFAPTKL